jgi:agmatine deiminase
MKICQAILITLLLSTAAMAQAGPGNDGLRLADPAIIEQLRLSEIEGLPKNLTPGERPHLRLPDLSLVPRQPPIADRIYTFSEYERNQAILMRWRPNVHDSVLTEMIVPITTGDGHAKVMLVVRPGSSDQSHAIDTLTAAGADMSRVEFVHAANDSIWIRDYGPRFASADGERIIVDHTYDRPRPNDNQVPAAVASYLDEDLYELPLSHGGGNFHLFSNGQAYMTDLILDENAGYTEQQLIDLYAQYHGLELTVLGALPSSFDSTQHLDMWFLPVDDETVIIGDYNNPPPGVSNAPASVIAVTEDTVSLMQARGYTVLRTPGWRTTTHITYTNSVIVNNLVLICRFNGYETQNAQALAIYEQAFPDMDIVQVNCSSIINQAGALHCIVKHKAFREFFELSTDPEEGSICLPSDGSAQLAVDLVMEGHNGHDFPVLISTSGLPPGVSDQLESSVFEEAGSLAWTLTADAGAEPGAFELTVSGDDGLEVVQLDFTLQLDLPPVATTLQVPQAGAIDVSLQPTFTWEEIEGVEDYVIQVAIDDDFSDPVIDAAVSATDFVPTADLDIGTDYYWRVRGLNHCGDGHWGEVRAFRTRFDPIAQITPDLLEFEVNIGNTDSQSLMVSNVGSGVLSFSVATSACGDNETSAWLSVHPASGESEAESSVPVEVTVDAQDLTSGTHNAALCVTTDQADAEPVTVPVIIEVLDLPPGEVEVAPTLLNFGSVGTGSSKSMSVMVSNVAEEGHDHLQIGQIGVIAGQSVFSVTGNDCGHQLAPQATCQIEIRFAPDNVTTNSGVLRIQADGQTTNVSLLGNGTEPEGGIFQDRFQADP